MLAISLAAFSLLWATPEQGGALFNTLCATCHKDPPVNRAPLPEVLRKMTREAILASMNTGSMREMASPVSIQQRGFIADYLTADAPPVDTMRGRCAAGFQPAKETAAWNGWGVDVENTRFQSAAAARITPAGVMKLQLRWAFGFPGVAAMGQPTAAAGRLYFGSANGTVYSTDARTGCIFWTFKAPVTVRTAITIVDGAAVFGDVEANVYALRIGDGSVIWKVKLDEHPVARITGAPQVHGGRVYVPVSSVEEVNGGSAKYGCCTFRGSVAALDLASGKVLWKTYTIPDPPRLRGKNRAGVEAYGPSGAAVWSAPALDLKLRRVYVGTGNAYSDPDTGHSDAIIAFDMDSGSMVWVRQLAAADRWNLACLNPNGANCPEKAGPDVDIGASPVLKTTASGKRVLLVGQKSGVVHALDPDDSGRIVWQSRIGAGGALGGVQWGMAADERNVYAALSDVHLREKAGGLFALKLETGERVWYAPPSPAACGQRRGCTPAQMAPVTAIGGVVFSGSMDGVLRAYDSATGRVIWEFNTLRKFDTVNGVEASGGSLNATGPVIAGGMLFVNSGYGVLGGMAGNVLLAFSAVEDKTTPGRSPAAGKR
ncbi:MAG: PQQ-binding-like beta-propeller repeat protein [Bryobacteraceae bacterium]|nr:PQQ-binding-like beta-propeller repeat protein [Bryobacteraceae bacterium]